jgi:hypothetical protein
MAADLAYERDAVKARDLTLALDPRGMTGGEAADQPAYPLSQLQREVWGGGAHQLTDVVDGDLAAFTQSIWMLCLTHFCGTTSSR